MEAQLIDPLTPLHANGNASRKLPRGAMEVRIDSYLRACGVVEHSRREHLLGATLGALGVDDQKKLLSWAEIIAAVDAVLARHMDWPAGPAPATGGRGRVALRLGVAAERTADWAVVPQRSLQYMRPQNLSPWRPPLRELLRLRIPRSTQGLAACLCWLAVLIIP